MMPAATTSQRDRAITLLKARGPMRRIELSDAGVHPETLARMLEDCILTRVTRGLYQLADAEVTAPHDLAEVAKLVPKGVICLVSALQFHDLTLQTPGRVWLAIGPKARKPKIDYPPTRIVRFGPRSLSLGDTSDAPASQELLKASRIISLGSLKSLAISKNSRASFTCGIIPLGI